MDTEQADQSRPWLAVGKEIADLLNSHRRQIVLPDRSGVRRRGAPLVLFRTGPVGTGRPNGGDASHACWPRCPFCRRSHGPSIRAAKGWSSSPDRERRQSASTSRGSPKPRAREVILFTRAPKSTLAGLADAMLLVPVEKTRQFGGSLFEQGSLILFDAIILEIARRIPDAHQRMLRRHTNLQ